MKKNKYFLGGDTEGILANVALSAGIGALAGGPVGALIGGGSALATGLIKQNQMKKNAAAEKKLQQKIASSSTNQQLNQLSGTLNLAANGGNLNTIDNGEFSEITTGGSHEANIFGGVPISVGANGINLAEEGETKNGSYIFSDRLKLNDASNKGLSAKDEGKTFAKVSKRYNDRERPNDPISKRTNNSMLKRLSLANDIARENEGGETGGLPVPNFFRDGGELGKKAYIFAETPPPSMQYSHELNMPKDTDTDLINQLRSQYNASTDTPSKEAIENQFYHSSINPIIEEADSSFVIEGNKLKDFYARQGIDAQVIPMYGLQDTSLVNNLGITPEDDVALFGHTGTKMAGIPNDWWAGKLKELKAKNCALGTCNGDKRAKFHDVPNLMRTGKDKWYGVNPYGKTLTEAMFSIDPDTQSIVKPVEGKNYVKSNK